MMIRKKSAWTFEGSMGSDAGIWLASATSGIVKLTKKDRYTYDRATLFYRAAGVGMGDLLPISVTLSTWAMPDVGDVYVTDNVSGPDLTLSDFDGLVFLHGASYNIGPVGASHTILVFGIPWSSVPKQIAKGVALNLIDYKSWLLGPLYGIYKAGKLVFGKEGDLPNMIGPLAGAAKGILIMKGMVAGVAWGAGLSVQFGYLSSESSVMPWEVDFKSTGEDIQVSYKVTKQDETILRIPGDVLFGFDKDWIGAAQGAWRKLKQR